MIETCRTYPRSTRDAFKEWPENAVGIEGPPVEVPTGWRRFFADLIEFLTQPSPFSDQR